MHLACFRRQLPDSWHPLLELFVTVEVVKPLGGSYSLLFPHLSISSVESYQANIRRSFSQWRYTRIKSLWLINTDIRQVVFAQEGEATFNVLLIEPGVMTELYGNPVLRKFFFASQNVVPLLVSRVEPRWKLEENDTELTSAIEWKKRMLKPPPELVSKFLRQVSQVEIRLLFQLRRQGLTDIFG